MIICHSRRFIFLHGRKTAGSSIGTCLNRFLSDGDASMGYVGACRDAGITPPDWDRRWQHLRPWDLRRRKPGYSAYKRMARERHGITSTHMPASAVKELVGDSVWNSYFKFTFERDPVERVISFYYWRTRGRKIAPSLENFVDAAESSDLPFLAKHGLAEFSNIKNYTLNGSLCVDYLGRFECLAKDMERLCMHLEIEWDGWLPNEKRGLRQRQKELSEGDDTKLRKRLAVVMKEESLMLGYMGAARTE